ncbi:hypothetical protein SUGI_0031830 [Cryptomeria japonica]|uniref:chitinase 2-like n=1 Tax=Cryptomeria japonica TaxID=3369 RepID=UPI002408A312|nr:chitinase 2-like [Cryptomeria japonica]GLJ06100.1 hypothetical protein SUGI_0031830 [Cryptomeria japonica]
MNNYIKLFVALVLLFLPQSLCGNAKLFKEYIGADDMKVQFSDVPILPDVEFHFILSFAIDYSGAGHSPFPTNGDFKIFWDKKTLRPSDVLDIKSKHKNVKVVVSLGGDVVGKNGTSVQFMPWSVSSWVQNAVSTLTQIINEYHLDGIDIDYEHFDYSDPNTFTECIGQLIVQLKQEKVISVASIAPYEDEGALRSHYMALWKKYGDFIDHVNFQFYAYDKGTTVEQFLSYFQIQESNYKGGKILASLGTDESSTGVTPEKFFEACRGLKEKMKLEGIFIWSADDSKKYGFQYELQSQALLAT